MKKVKLASIEDKVAWAVEFCREKGLRRTKALRALLSYLFQYDRPISWAALSKAPEIQKCCDPSSAFRVLIKLQETGLVKRVGSPDRSYYFMLTLPGEHHDHLICTDCGKIENLDFDCPVAQVEKKIISRTGYKALHHELEFFGVCPDCQPAKGKGSSARTADACSGHYSSTSS